MPQLTPTLPPNSNKHENGAVAHASMRFSYEILLPIDIAFAIASVALRSWTLFRPFAQIERKINQLLGIRQTDFTRGYIAVAVPSLLLAIVLWAVLRIAVDNKLMKGFLRSVSGFMVLFAPAIFWIYVYEQDGWPVGWPYKGAPFEIVLIFLAALLFLSQKIVIPSFVSMVVLIAHFSYWYWVPSTNPSMPNYAGPAASIIGFFTALAWSYYVRTP
jgi:hypothetical protein